MDNTRERNQLLSHLALSLKRQNWAKDSVKSVIISQQNEVLVKFLIGAWMYD